MAPCYPNLYPWGCSMASWAALSPAVASPSHTLCVFTSSSLWDVHKLCLLGRSKSSTNLCQQRSDQRRPCKMFKTMTRVFVRPFAAREPSADRRVCSIKIRDEAGNLTVNLAVSWSLLGSLSLSVPIGVAADMDSFSNLLPMSSSQGMTILTFLDPGNAALASNILGPLLAAFNLLFIIRIVMSWYPQLPVNKLPYVIAYAPTEPVLAPTRKLIPPVGGVDISPVIWVALVSFSNEILLGQQGLLVLLSQQQP
ncbi:hypothetical protein O6H91_05G109200 [Diphasiastrum complanatum]|uniref:Uncharacterized protein n=2 Tax=Diphasiastrum complanatum TaxID=34168 RepID=A0ACC2DSB8_DIPCM|nr:hypothetical protein O6H91_05G061300 [Diphasiastrum complanatum]KAJ7557032.1 hypothetical protein O6H91_05G109200 [Diphasiastrum complanatum]